MEKVKAYTIDFFERNFILIAVFLALILISLGVALVFGGDSKKKIVVAVVSIFLIGLLASSAVLVSSFFDGIIIPKRIEFYSDDGELVESILFRNKLYQYEMINTLFEDYLISNRNLEEMFAGSHYNISDICIHEVNCYPRFCAQSVVDIKSCEFLEDGVVRADGAYLEFYNKLYDFSSSSLLRLDDDSSPEKLGEKYYVISNLNKDYNLGFNLFDIDKSFDISRISELDYMKDIIMSSLDQEILFLGTDFSLGNYLVQLSSALGYDAKYLSFYELSKIYSPVYELQATHLSTIKEEYDKSFFTHSCSYNPSKEYIYDSIDMGSFISRYFFNCTLFCYSEIECVMSQINLEKYELYMETDIDFFYVDPLSHYSCENYENANQELKNLLTVYGWDSFDSLEIEQILNQFDEEYVNCFGTTGDQGDEILDLVLESGGEEVHGDEVFLEPDEINFVLLMESHRSCLFFDNPIMNLILSNLYYVE
ncbi:MAG: hypothetical protein ACOCUR_00140 [Nanoarchaeota archaeon]